jgi:hypothetical protein
VYVTDDTPHMLINHHAVEMQLNNQ